MTFHACGIIIILQLWKKEKIMLSPIEEILHGRNVFEKPLDEEEHALLHKAAELADELSAMLQDLPEAAEIFCKYKQTADDLYGVDRDNYYKDIFRYAFLLAMDIWKIR